MYDLLGFDVCIHPPMKPAPRPRSWLCVSLCPELPWWPFASPLLILPASSPATCELFFQSGLVFIFYTPRAMKSCSMYSFAFICLGLASYNQDNDFEIHLSSFNSSVLWCESIVRSFSWWELFDCMAITMNLFIYSSSNEHLDCFQFLAITSKSLLWTHVFISLG